MILDTLKCYVIAHPYCTQRELANAFSLSEDGIDAMLSVWVKKGKVKIKQTKVNDKQERRYLWIENEEIALTLIQ